MNPPASILAQVVDDLRVVLSDDSLPGLSVADRAEALRLIGEATRLVEAVTVELVASADADFGHRFGCHGMNELLQRTLLIDGASAAKTILVADSVAREVSLVSGERLPARWPALREALLDGAVGVAGVRAATASLDQARDRIGAEGCREADALLARVARGQWGRLGSDIDRSDIDTSGIDPGTDSGDPTDAHSTDGPRATPGELRAIAKLLAMRLDPDGAEPADEAAQRRRFLKVGVGHDGLHRLTGCLLPEVAAQLSLILDAYNNPKVGGAPAPGVRFVSPADDGSDDPLDKRPPCDPRTAGQRDHDALAAVLGIAARHDEMPRLGGAAPTLVVQIDVHALHPRAAAGAGFETGTGSEINTGFNSDAGFGSVAGFGSETESTSGTTARWATIPGIDTPVPVAVATQTGCSGTVQRVFTDRGRIVDIDVADRVFTAAQRRAITLRDHECLIPGCRVPATWCEIHHVTAHADGGPTHTDNGVTLCWWHHRSLPTSGWEIRMNRGTPEIRGPAWWDPHRRWRPPRHAHGYATPLAS